MHRRLTSVSSIQLLIFLIGSVAWADGPEMVADEALTIRLHAHVRVSHPLVQIGHLAEITGVHSIGVDRVRKLDVMQLTDVGTEQILSREQIQIRLLLAGIPLKQVTMIGAAAVTVSLETVCPYRSLDIEEAAATSMAMALGVPREDVNAKLVAPLEIPSDHAATLGQSISIDVLPPVRPTPGRVRLTVRLLADGQLERTLSGLFDVRVRRTVVLATAALPSGTVLAADHLTVSEEWSHERPLPADVTEMFDRQLRRSVPAGEPIEQRDLKPTTEPMLQPLIRAGDLVRLMVRHANLTVSVPSAEAIQSGVLGETIRVRNLESRKIVVGRIISTGEVEVRLE